MTMRVESIKPGIVGDAVGVDRLISRLIQAGPIAWTIPSMTKIESACLSGFQFAGNQRANVF